DKAAVESGFVHQDKDTGEWVIPTSFFPAAAPILNMMFGGDGPFHGGFSLSAPVAGLNMFFSDTYKIPSMGFLKPIAGLPVPMPGFDPPFLWLTQKLASSKALPPTLRDSLS